MPNPLSVSPDGLNAAWAVLNENAGQLGTARMGSPAGNKASSAGAAAVTSAIAAFNLSYARRLTDHGQSARTAAGNYATVDNDGAADIGSVSM